MGVFLGRGSQVDVRAISLEMRKSVRDWETVHIVILNPGENGAYLRDRNDAAFVWDGMARLQPYRREVATATVTQPTTNQSVRFQVDFSEDGGIPDIRTDYQVVVLPESLTGIQLNDPYLPFYQHVVRSTLNSSLAWIRTIECQVNTDLRVNYSVSVTTDGGGGYKWARGYGSGPYGSGSYGSGPYSL